MIHYIQTVDIDNMKISQIEAPCDADLTDPLTPPDPTVLNYDE